MEPVGSVWRERERERERGRGRGEREREKEKEREKGGVSVVKEERYTKR